MAASPLSLGQFKAMLNTVTVHCGVLMCSKPLWNHWVSARESQNCVSGLTLHSYQSSTSLRLRSISVSYWHLISSRIFLRSGPGQALTSTLTSPVDCFLRQFISWKHHPDRVIFLKRRKTVRELSSPVGKSRCPGRDPLCWTLTAPRSHELSSPTPCPAAGSTPGLGTTEGGGSCMNYHF